MKFYHNKSFTFFAFSTILYLTTISSNLYSQNTYVPDDNFERRLIQLGYDTFPLDDYVPTANISSIQYLDTAVEDISDLTGIEDFASLLTLYCYGNNLSTLDVSNNFLLENLYCDANQLQSLNVSNNPNLEKIVCYENLLTNLDISSCSNLTLLYLNQNELITLNTDNNTSLQGLYVDDNQLTSLNLNYNLQLIDFSCHKNLLTSLDLSHNTMLQYISCYDNQLTEFNIKSGTNTNIYNFKAYNNPDLLCIQVDDPVYSTNNWTEIDPQTTFSEDCTIGITELTNSNISIYPNPVINSINIQNDSFLDLKEMYLYDLNGRLIKTTVSKTMDISSLKSGVYYLDIITSEGSIIKRIIKQD